jgi:hypothetical protein
VADEIRTNKDSTQASQRPQRGDQPGDQRQRERHQSDHHQTTDWLADHVDDDRDDGETAATRSEQREHTGRDDSDARRRQSNR